MTKDRSPDKGQPSKHQELLDYWKTLGAGSNERLAVDILEPLLHSVQALYFAAHWHPDRPVDEAALWTAVRDAAGIKPGQTGERLGADRTAQRPSLAAPEGEFTVGAYTLRKGVEPGKVWIEHETGEGGDFTASKVEAAIASFYTKHF